MLSQLTGSFKIGLKIKDKLKEQKNMLIEEYICHIGGYKQATYMYINEEEKEVHKLKMLHAEWAIIESQSYMHIYHDFFDTAEHNNLMLVPCQIYEKRIIKNLDL